MSAKLLHALAHSRDPDSKKVAGITAFIFCLTGHTAPVIAYVDGQTGSRPGDADNGNLNIPREPAKLSGYIELGFDPTTLFESSGVPLQCRGEARFIQKRRMQ